LSNSGRKVKATTTLLDKPAVAPGACSRANIRIAGPSATSVDESFAFDASLVSMNSGITSRLAIARNSAL
jgi:hypothetical protein